MQLVYNEIALFILVVGVKTSRQPFDWQVAVESPMRLASPKRDRALSPEELLLAEKDWRIQAGSCIPTNVQLDLCPAIDLMG